jgi:hypothetical protein
MQIVKWTSKWVCTEFHSKVVSLFNNEIIYTEFQFLLTVDLSLWIVVIYCKSVKGWRVEKRTLPGKFKIQMRNHLTLNLLLKEIINKWFCKRNSIQWSWRSKVKNDSKIDRAALSGSGGAIWQSVKGLDNESETQRYSRNKQANYSLIKTYPKSNSWCLISIRR